MKKQQLLFKYPPDLQKAQKHRLANRILKGIQKDPNCQTCSCCDRKIGALQPNVNFCYELNLLAYLGPGIPLFFAFIKYNIIMLIAFTLIFSGFCLYSNISSDYCHYDSQDCQYNIFNTISLANKMDSTDLLSIQNYILISFVVLNIFLFQIFRFNFRKIKQECDEVTISPSDYAIILRRLPNNITKEDIEVMIQQKRGLLTQQQKQKTQNLKIDHIVLSFSMDDYIKTKNSNRQNFKKSINMKSLQYFTPEPLPKLNKSGKLAVVIFSRAYSRQLFLYKPSISQRFILLCCSSYTPLADVKVKQKQVTIQKAPQPDDIIWQNCTLSIKSSIIRKTAINIISFIVLLIGGIIQYGLAVLQNQFADPLVKQLLSVGFSLVVTLFNYILLQMIQIFSQKRGSLTITELNQALIVKITFYQFLNTGVFVIIANFLANIDHFTLTDQLPSDITLIMIINAFGPNLSLWFLSYFQLPQRFYRAFVRWKFLKVNQIEANKYWERPKAQIPYKYAYVLKTIWLTAFYAPLVPIVVPISIFGLIINYFLQKYLFGFVYTAPNTLNTILNQRGIIKMEYFPFIMSLGQFIVYIYMYKFDANVLPLNWSFPIYLSIVISGLNILLPMDSVNKYFKLKNDDKTIPSYEQIEQKLEVTYEMTNPGYECKKKRKRDLFLQNLTFGYSTIKKQLFKQQLDNFNKNLMLRLDNIDKYMQQRISTQASSPLLFQNTQKAGNNFFKMIQVVPPQIPQNQIFTLQIKQNENENQTRNKEVLRQAIKRSYLAYNLRNPNFYKKDLIHKQNKLQKPKLNPKYQQS